ncbi:hypothetical protein DFH06DRAFT_1314298 [Mycena polygramma]|nr:hypothetical protein DFH06DRAFT_1314298 [Mycena polygramma]
MKFISSTFFSLTLAALVVATNNARSPPANALQKRSEKCSITGDGSRCRRSPSLSADVIGEFAIGTTQTFTCFSIGDSVEGDVVWDKTTVNIGGKAIPCFVSDTLTALPCPGGLPQC